MTGAGDGNDLLQQAVAAHNAGQADLALQLYQQLLAQQPANPHVLTLLATLLHQQGNVAQAVRTFHLALEINPHGIDSNFFYADFLMSEGRDDEARKYFQNALQAPPRDQRAVADEGRRTEIQAKLAELEH